MPLYIVATPVGNLEDMSRRALRVLAEVDYVLAEDTRTTGKLLSLVGVKARLRAYHDHSNVADRERIVRELVDGQDIALVSDAGTPCVSDPGYALVRDAAAAGVSVVPVPGASSVLAFLSAAGLPTDCFQFVGFGPRKAGARDAAVAEWFAYSGTTVVLEAPTRLVALLQALAQADPDRGVVVGRELTKLHEEFVRGTAASVLAAFQDRDRIRGECVVGVAPDDAEALVTDVEVDAWIQELLDAGLRTKAISQVLSRRLGVPAASVYERAVALRER